ncbi:hypothetical protein F4677DRAFT_438945 [Hypoxylon crocopeplum]|nr:hypothetical protein F4677DRAFT_438945 [Hypoxylon crocopeplum]
MSRMTIPRPASSNPNTCVRLDENNRDELGIRAVQRTERGTKLGRDLVAFAEGLCRDNLRGPGMAVTQLELFVPTYIEHVSKTSLEVSSTRLGYRIVGTVNFTKCYPKLAPLPAGRATELRCL